MFFSDIDLKIMKMVSFEYENLLQKLPVHTGTLYSFISLNVKYIDATIIDKQTGFYRYNHIILNVMI